MARPARVASLAAALLLSAVGAGSCGGGGAELVAQVGALSVTKPALHHWLQTQSSFIDAGCGPTPLASAAAGQGATSGCSSASRTRAQRALDFLIASRRVLGQAAEMGIAVSEKEVKSTLERAEYSRLYGNAGVELPHEAQLQGLLAGKASSDRPWIVKVWLLAGRIEQRQRESAERMVPGSAVSAFYARHKGRFIVHERRTIASIITFTKARVLKAKREIEAGKSIESVAAYANEQPGEGGVREISRATLGPKRYEKDFFAPHLKLNTLVGPLKELMYYIFELKRVVPARQRTLAEVQATIRQQLIEGPFHGLLVGIVQSEAQRWHARTRCKPAYATPTCSGTL